MHLTKHCKKCGQDLPFDTTCFHRETRALSGLNPVCKACVADSRVRKAKRDLALKQPYPPYAQWAVYEVQND